jgi:hypothetical protein
LFHLDLSFELGISDTANPIQPAVTLTSAAYIFNYIRSHSLSSVNPRLMELDINSGSQRKMGGGYPAAWVMWEQRERQQFTVRMAEKVEDARAGKVIVQCLALERARKTYRMEVEAAGEEEEQDQWLEADLAEALDRAENGPRATQDVGRRRGPAP